MRNAPCQIKRILAVLAVFSALLALLAPGRAAAEPPRNATAEPSATAAPPATPTGHAPELRRLTWPTEADSGIVHILPISGGVGIALDTKLCGRVDRVITMRGEVPPLPATRDALGAVMYHDVGLALVLHKTTQAFVFTLGNPPDAAWIGQHVPAGFALTIVPAAVEVARYEGDFGSSSDNHLPSIFNQDPGGDTPPPSPRCASQCTISCRDGSSCTCSAGAAGCCSCTCSLVAGAQCTHLP